MTHRMAAVQQPGRRRISSKSYTGCVACRAAKHKCSEEKPNCARCVRLKRVCEYNIAIVIVEPSSQRRTSTARRRSSADKVSDSSTQSTLHTIVSTSSTNSSSRSSIDPNDVVGYNPTFFPDLTELDLLYLQYFAMRLPDSVPLGSYFPGSIRYMIQLGFSDVRALPVVLCVGAFHAEECKGKVPLWAYMHHQTAIANIQSALISGIGLDDDWLLMSVFLLMHILAAMGDHAGMRRHVNGLKTLLRRHRSKPPSQQSRLLFIVEEITTTLDMVVAATYTRHPILEDRLPHKAQLCDTVAHECRNPLDAERRVYTFAHLQQVRIMRRALELERRTIWLRSKKLREEEGEKVERRIAKQVQILQEELRTWHTEFSLVADGTHITDNSRTGRFLTYPPIQFTNILYAHQMLHFHAGFIYISFVADPRPGPITPDRLTHAIEVCRIEAGTWVASGGSASEKAVRSTNNQPDLQAALYLAGLCFGLQHESERNWVLDALARVQYIGGYPSAGKAAHGLRLIWNLMRQQCIERMDDASDQERVTPVGQELSLDEFHASLDDMVSSKDKQVALCIEDTEDVDALAELKRVSQLEQAAAEAFARSNLAD